VINLLGESSHKKNTLGGVFGVADETDLNFRGIGNMVRCPLHAEKPTLLNGSRVRSQLTKCVNPPGNREETGGSGFGFFCGKGKQTELNWVVTR